MSQRSTRVAESADTVAEALNEVRIRGRVTAAPQRRVLPSGDEIVALRVSVPRPDGRSDALDATAWVPGTRRITGAWAVDDVVEIEGAVRRRFWRSPSGPASRWEIEIQRCRRVRRGGPTAR